MWQPKLKAQLISSPTANPIDPTSELFWSQTISQPVLNTEPRGILSKYLLNPITSAQSYLVASRLALSDLLNLASCCSPCHSFSSGHCGLLVVLKPARPLLPQAFHVCSFLCPDPRGSLSHLCAIFSMRLFRVTLFQMYSLSPILLYFFLPMAYTLYFTF